MYKGYLKKDCVIGPGVKDGVAGQEVTPETIGQDAFRKLVFNGALSSEGPAKVAKPKKV